jgi:hypothetical protein
MQAEIRANAGWEAVGPIFKSFGQPTSEPYTERDYALFAVLADIRNDWELDFIQLERGLPPDLAPHPPQAGDDAFDGMERDDYFAPEIFGPGSENHSPGWATLAELEAYDWEQQLCFDDEEPCAVRELIDRRWFEVVKRLREFIPAVEVKTPPAVAGDARADGFASIFGQARGVNTASAPGSAENVRIIFFFSD